MRLLVPFVAIVVVAGCGDSVIGYEMSAAAMEKFAANAEELGARDDANSPIAMSVLASNRIGAPEGVKIWNPDATLKSVGINNGDLIALVDGQVPSREYGNAFAAGQKPFGNAAQQYVHFVSGLLALRDSQDALLLSIHPQYRTSAEREKHGGIHAKEPTMIRIVFQ